MRHSQQIVFGLLLFLPTACVADSRWPRIETQQWPAPMQVVPGSFDTGALHGIISNEPGNEEVLVLRYGDPVQVRPAGGTSAYPLAFHDKEVHLNAGSWVLCSPGGKVEILWHGGTSIVFSGQTTGLVGSPSRGEPTFAFVELESALLNLRFGDQVRLLGGAVVSAESGPLALERLDSGILRVENQSKGEARIMFREADFRLDPGQEIHLPLLSAGGEPLGSSVRRRRYSDEEMVLELEGAAEMLSHVDGVMVVTSGAHEIRAMGLRLQLGEGEQLLLRGVKAGDAVPSATDPVPVPEPDPEPESVTEPDSTTEVELETESEVGSAVGGEATGGGEQC